jgi:hypothetical protein
MEVIDPIIVVILFRRNTLSNQRMLRKGAMSTGRDMVREDYSRVSGSLTFSKISRILWANSSPLRGNLWITLLTL